LKKSAIVLIFLLLFVINVFSQTVTLRRGVYKTQGSDDEILILPDTAFDIYSDGFRPRYGSYGMSVWSGTMQNDKLIYIASGFVSGNGLNFFVNEVNTSLILGSNGTIPIIYTGSLLAFTITAHEAFLDNTGRRWFYHRDNRGF